MGLVSSLFQDQTEVDKKKIELDTDEYHEEREYYNGTKTFEVMYVHEFSDAFENPEGMDLEIYWGYSNLTIVSAFSVKAYRKLHLIGENGEKYTLPCILGETTDNELLPPFFESISPGDRIKVRNYLITDEIYFAQKLENNPYRLIDWHSDSKIPSGWYSDDPEESAPDGYRVFEMKMYPGWV